VNILIAQQGGMLILDEAFEAQPTAATVTLVTTQNQALSVVHASFADITDAACVVSDMQLTLPATNRGARLFAPTVTSGTVDDMTAPGYQILISRGGRRYYGRVGEYDTDAGDVTSFMIDEGIDFAIKSGDVAYGLRVSYDVDWSAVTDEDFVGEIQALWKVTVGGRVIRIRRVYDVVRQELLRQATWADVLALRPDADDNMSQVRDKEKLVENAWEITVRDLYNMGIRHNLLIPNTNTALRDATVLQTLINLTVHQALPVPATFMTQPEVYLDRLNSDRSKALGRLAMPLDADQNMVLTNTEQHANKRVVQLRGRII
jgi:hypothetical protein